MMDKQPSIAITGCGCISAAGSSTKDAFETLGRFSVHNSAVGQPYFPEPFVAPCFFAQEITEVNSPFFIYQSKTDPFFTKNRKNYLILHALHEALMMSGLQPDRLKKLRVGVALGTTVGSTFHYEQYYRDWKNGREPDAEVMDHFLDSNLVGFVQRTLKVFGPKALITNACASGTDAIGLAKLWLEQDLCDIAVAGGVDDLSKIACHGFKSLMLVSEQSCTPFDQNRKGLNLGEAAGVMILQKESLIKDQASILGWVRGYGIAGDAYHPTAPHPEGRGLQQAVKKALSDYSLLPADIHLINAHGTGTKANDKAETTAVSMLGFDTVSTPLVSTKGATGHTLGAAGAIEAIFTLSSLNSGRVFGSIGCESADPDFSCQVLPHGATMSLKGRLGLSQSLAFGGNNSALILEGSGKWV